MDDPMPAQVEDLGGGVEEIRREEWSSRAMWDPSYRKESLQLMGFPGQSISEADQIYQDWKEADEEADRTREKRLDNVGRSGVHYYGGPIAELERIEMEPHTLRQTYMERLGTWFGWREVEVVESQSQEISVPLFLLTAPPIPDCSVELERKSTSAGRVKWTMNLYGIGAESVLTAATSISARFCASEGQSRQAFLPVRIETNRVIVKNRGKVIGSGFTYVPHLIPGMHPAAYPMELTELEMDHSDPAVFPLEKDDPESTTVYELAAHRSKDGHLSLGFDAFNTRFTLEYNTSVGVDTGLTCNLRGGHRYIAYGVKDRAGILWEVGADRTPGADAPV